MARIPPSVAVILVVLIAILKPSIGAGDPTESLPGVLDLTTENFDKVVNGAKAALVEFYAPWCGHCKHLTPEYKKLGVSVESDAALKSRLVIAKVDADAHSALGQRFGVQGFPTIKFFARGKEANAKGAADYNGGRTSDAMLSFLKKKLDADKGFARVKELDSIAEKAAKGDVKKALAELEAAAAKLEGAAKEHGEVYVKLAKKGAEKGAEYFATERARLERMIASGSVAANKIKDMIAKSSILGGFLGEPIPDMPADAEEEEEEEEGEEEEEEEKEEDEEEEKEEDDEEKTEE